MTSTFLLFFSYQDVQFCCSSESIHLHYFRNSGEAGNGAHEPGLEKFALQEISNWITMDAEVLVVHFERLLDDWDR